MLLTPTSLPNRNGVFLNSAGFEEWNNSQSVQSHPSPQFEIATAGSEQGIRLRQMIVEAERVKKEKQDAKPMISETETAEKKKVDMPSLRLPPKSKDSKNRSFMPSPSTRRPA
jgi:hypothetical protein